MRNDILISASKLIEEAIQRDEETAVVSAVISRSKEGFSTELVLDETSPVELAVLADDLLAISALSLKDYPDNPHSSSLIEKITAARRALGISKMPEALPRLLN